MILEKYTSSISNKASEITFLRLTVGMLLIVIIIMGFTLLKTMSLEKTVIVPPTINKSFWVTGDTVSKDYLEQMAYWYAGLVLNVTSTTGEYQRQQFLRYATPADSGRLAAEMTARIDFLAKNTASTQFSAETINVNEDLKKVAIVGNLSTFVGDKRISTKRTSYVVGFKYLNSRLYVSEFKETNEQDMYGTSIPAGK